MADIVGFHDGRDVLWSDTFEISWYRLLGEFDYRLGYVGYVYARPMRTYFRSITFEPIVDAFYALEADRTFLADAMIYTFSANKVKVD